MDSSPEIVKRSRGRPKRSSYEISSQKSSTPKESGRGSKTPVRERRSRSVSRSRSAPRSPARTVKERKPSPSRVKKERKQSPSRNKSIKQEEKKIEVLDSDKPKRRSQRLQVSQIKTVETISTASSSSSSSSSSSTAATTTKTISKLNLFVPLLVLALGVGLSIPIFSLEWIISRQPWDIKNFYAYPKAVNQYLGAETAKYYAGWIALHILLSSLLFGATIRKQELERTEYKLNGILQAFMMFVFSISSAYFDLIPKEVRNHNYLVLGTVLAWILALIVHYRNFNSFVDFLSPKKKPYTFDFIFGHSINPKLAYGKFDLKHFLFKYGFITLLCQEILYVGHEFHRYKIINFTLIQIVISHIVLASLVFYNEHHLLSTTFYLRGKFGFIQILLFLVIIPYFFSLPVVYAYRQRIPSNFILMGISGVINIIGLIIFYYSTCCKDGNQLSSNYVANERQLYSSKSSFGSGIWKHIRHPHYLALIIIVFSTTLPIGGKHIIPWLPFLATAFFFVVRSVLIEKQHEGHIGKSWQQYKSGVRSRIVPKIF